MSLDQLPGAFPYDALCLVSGILALMSIVEKRSFARAVCAGLATIHGAVVLAYVALPDILTANSFGFSLLDLALSAAVALSCMWAIWRAAPSRRIWIGPRFDDRLAGSHRPYLTIEE